MKEQSKWLFLRPFATHTHLHKLFLRSERCQTTWNGSIMIWAHNPAGGTRKHGRNNFEDPFFEKNDFFLGGKVIIFKTIRGRNGLLRAKNRQKRDYFDWKWGPPLLWARTKQEEPRNSDIRLGDCVFASIVTSKKVLLVPVEAQICVFGHKTELNGAFSVAFSLRRSPQPG